VLSRQALRPVFQPIVDLDTRRPVAYEALIRGPEGSGLERPDDLFAAARASGLVAELCSASRRAALEEALASGLDAPFALFLNVEPEALDEPAPGAIRDRFAAGPSSLRLVFEVTERALTARPAELLRSVRRLRSRGWGIALDDIGADRHSLALMPFLRPDVMKLDLRLIQSRPSVEIAEIVNAVVAEAERTGASVVAEGIETEEHLATAVAVGAGLGQGWMFGRPGALPSDPPEAGRAVELVGGSLEPSGVTPFQRAERAKTSRRATKRHLLWISRQLEEEAGRLGEATVVMSAFQKGTRFAGDARRRYGALARHAAFVGAFGVGMGEQPAPGVRGALIDPGDPLVDEWDVAVIAPHFAGLMAARDIGDQGPDMDRRFDFVVTYERDVVLDAARALMGRVAAQAERGSAPGVPPAPTAGPSVDGRAPYD